MLVEVRVKEKKASLTAPVTLESHGEPFRVMAIHDRNKKSSSFSIKPSAHIFTRTTAITHLPELEHRLKISVSVEKNHSALHGVLTGLEHNLD
jgi:hypothetical protein